MDHDSVFVTMDKEELLPLCESNDDLEGKPPQNPVPRRWEGHKSIRLFPWPLILIHAAFILAYTVAFFVLVSAETPMSSLVYCMCILKADAKLNTGSTRSRGFALYA